MLLNNNKAKIFIGPNSASVTRPDCAPAAPFSNRGRHRTGEIYDTIRWLCRLRVRCRETPCELSSSLILIIFTLTPPFIIKPPTSSFVLHTLTSLVVLFFQSIIYLSPFPVLRTSVRIPSHAPFRPHCTTRHHPRRPYW